MIPLMCKVQNKHIHKDRKQSSGHLGRGEGARGVTAMGTDGSGRNVLKSVAVLVAHVYKYMKATELYSVKG